MSKSRYAALAIAAGSLIAAPTLRAQQAAPVASIMYASPSSAARMPVTLATTKPLDRQAAAARAVRAEPHVGAGKNVALMVVGAAGIVTGALVGGSGGTAIALGGAAVGLYGLYRFVQ